LTEVGRHFALSLGYDSKGRIGVHLDTYLAIAGIVIGLAATVMAIPPLFQMMFGRPRLEFHADDFTGPDGKLLLIAIKNTKTKSRFLRKIGVEREVGNVHAFIDIQEQGTNRFVRKDIFGCSIAHRLGSKI
jgi:hypothetical protein